MRSIAGMCLLDTIDGALMMTLYTSTLAKDTLGILYYSVVLTTITVIVAIIIGLIQLLSLVLNVSQPTGKFWERVGVAADHYDIIGKNAVCVLRKRGDLRHVDRRSNMLLLRCLWGVERTAIQTLETTN